MGLIKYNNQSISSISDVSNTDGSMILIKTVTASSDSTINFVHGTSDVVFDSTYPIYLIRCISVHPQTDDKNLQFRFTTDGTNFNVTTYSAPLGADHSEDGTTTASLSYKGGNDPDDDGEQSIGASTGADNDQASSGELYIFSPSSTTYVKHYLSRSSQARHSDAAQDFFTGGYANTTSAITGLRFKFQSGNIDAGTFKLYGIKDS
tara:strand:+ start:438 stop:1055 length:618 start_codon:yes stop_codon:yes gene_type:complete